MPLILDLCGGTGSWSRPYVEAGYEVRIIDPLADGSDVRLLLHVKDKVHGILAAPPCTMFCRMRMCRGRPTDEQFKDALSVVDACLRAVTLYSPAWWALENPQGYLKLWLGEPQLKFHPADYGDPWTKRTWLWGRFNTPKQTPVVPTGAWVKRHEKDGKQSAIARNTSQRSMTPPGFARAFFEANQ